MSHTHFAPIFTDHLVLQRGKPIKLWGTCTPGTSLCIQLCTNDSSPTDARDAILSEIRLTSQGEQFRAELPALSEGGPYRLLLWEDDLICQDLRDAMIGEVWLAGGQSNMEYELQNDADAVSLFSSSQIQTEIHGQLKSSVASDCKTTSPAADRSPDVQGNVTTFPKANVRFYQVMRKAYFEENDNETEYQTETGMEFGTETANGWMTADDPGFGTWSAVAYHYASELSVTLGCCVGVIGCNWGGTSASAWQDRESLLAHPETAVYWEEYRNIVDRQSPEEYEKARREYALYQESWQPKIDEFYSKNPTGSWEEALSYAGPCLWPGPMGPKHEFRPCGLYETMLRRVTPYSLRGFLYYQGESDDHRPDAYYTLLKSLIRVWRRDFEDEGLYFLNVQLPMHRYENDPPSDSWSRIREAQLKLHREDPLSGLAVAIDLGEFNNIHPLHKKEVGHRLFLQSMTHVYRLLPKEDAYGPLIRKANFSADTHSIRLEFNCAQAGFDRERYLAVTNLPHDDGSMYLQGFEVAGPDGVYYPAEPDFQTGDQTVSLRLPEEIASPASVRYLWTNYSLVPLFDRSGMPAAPFQLAL